jgi:hypothetical protein
MMFKLLIFTVKTITCLFSARGHLPVVAALAHFSLDSTSQSYDLLDGHWTGLVVYCRTTTGHYAVAVPSLPPVVHRHHKTTTDHCAVPSLGGRVVLPLFLSHRGRRPVAD